MKDYRYLITAYKIKQSISRNKNCWGNVCIESLFHSVYGDAIQYETIMTRTQMRQTPFEYIEMDYSRTKRHATLAN